MSPSIERSRFRILPPHLAALGLQSVELAIDGASQAHVVVGGLGTPMLLLHGWPQTWLCWRLTLPVLVKRHKVFVVDLPGVAGSDPWSGGASTSILADWCVRVLDRLGVEAAHMVGHDVGAWIAAAFVVTNPARAISVSFLDGALPGITPDAFYGLREGAPTWHFHVHANPRAAQFLIGNRPREYVEWFMRSKSAAPTFFRSEDLEPYLSAYGSWRELQESFRWYQNLPDSAASVRQGLARRPYEGRVLAMSGAKARGSRMIDEVRGAFPQAKGVVLPDVGHYLPEEAPYEVARYLDELASG
jgi:pimeloyl-ACP methyl ester carboxylesterase